MSVEPEVRLVNDIARQFAHLDHEAALAAINDHLDRFWDPRMRARLRGHAAAGGQGLHPLALDAARRLDPSRTG